MPKREDLTSILVIGAGPIIIGQGCEFDYSGAQACKALKEEGYRVILVNSNPATIMTDPTMADSVYIEPIVWQSVAKIIEKERPDAILPTMGGQSALNCALDLVKHGITEKYNIELIGAKKEAIDKAEDRDLFRAAMQKIGLKMPKSKVANTLDDAKKIQQEIGFPTIIRPSFTLGGTGGGIAYNNEEFEEICRRGLELSPTSELLIEESIIGFKEFEMEVVRDKQDNCIIICAIENIDPMGVHTGDSITVAPAQTLTDQEYQLMRDASIKVLREIGVDTGGSNVQFAQNPANGELYVIEMNPRVSRSSALASKATGFPIAKIAAKLAVGYTLDELSNAITGSTPASFEPSIDYVVTKIPRFNFEKFPKADDRLTTQMKSVGEVMAIGRTMQESLQKAIRGLEIDRFGFESLSNNKDKIIAQLQTPSKDRLWNVADAFRVGLSIDEVYQYTKIDKWFLAQIEDLIITEQSLDNKSILDLTKKELFNLKQQGFADQRLADLLNSSEDQIRQLRDKFNIKPVYKRVDSVAAEFSVNTAYMYSTYEQECEAEPTNNQKIMVLGGGPNRIGQGIEFDYCCVHAAFSAKELGYETIMVNCNPETVSTDYDTSDRLYFEPLTLEDVLAIVKLEKPLGVIVQFGGQTPLKLAKDLEENGVPILGTSVDAIDRAEDRARFLELINKLNIKQPPNGCAKNIEQALAIAHKINYPIIVRPSYVLGGRAMEIAYNDAELISYMNKNFVNQNFGEVLIDSFLDDAVEVDVDAVCDGKQVLIGSIMEHIEQAGVHSGDSACCIPPFSLSDDLQATLKQKITQIALELGVIGLINAQFAIKNNEIYILEVNPRAARTVPFVSKVLGVSLASIAVKCMLGVTLQEQGLESELIPGYYAIKKSVFPFVKFPDTDPILGPEMRSTGEVMGTGSSFAEAYAKSDLATMAPQIPKTGVALLSVRDEDKTVAISLARKLSELGYKLMATRGTWQAMISAGLNCQLVNKVHEGRPDIVDCIKNRQIAFIINTTSGQQAILDSNAIRKAAVQYDISYTTTISGAKAQIMALLEQNEYDVWPILSLHKRVFKASNQNSENIEMKA